VALHALLSFDDGSAGVVAMESLDAARAAAEPGADTSGLLLPRSLWPLLSLAAGSAPAPSESPTRDDVAREAAAAAALALEALPRRYAAAAAPGDAGSSRLGAALRPGGLRAEPAAWLSRPMCGLRPPSGATSGSLLALARAVVRRGAPTVVVGAVGAAVGVWRVPLGRLPEELEAEESLVGPAACVTALAVAVEEEEGGSGAVIVAAGDASGAVSVWSASSGRPVASLRVAGEGKDEGRAPGRRRRGRSGGSGSLSSAGGAGSAGGARDGGTASLGEAVTAVALTGRLLVAGSQDGTVAVWGRRQGRGGEVRPVLLARQALCHRDAPVAGMWGAEGAAGSVLTAGSAGSLRLWQPTGDAGAEAGITLRAVRSAGGEAGGGRRLGSFAERGAAPGAEKGGQAAAVVCAEIPGHEGRVTCASLNGRRGVSADSDGLVRFWQVGPRAGRLLRSAFLEPPEAVTCLDATGSADVVAVGTANGRVHVLTLPSPPVARVAPPSATATEPAAPRTRPRRHASFDVRADPLAGVPAEEAAMVALAIRRSLDDQRAES